MGEELSKQGRDSSERTRSLLDVVALLWSRRESCQKGDCWA
jgi:hypothetical protein